jgi:putative FmdB family regulatory protein
MPTYEYKCKKCGDRFEQRLGFFHNHKSVKCPKCGDEVERVFSPFAAEHSCGDSSIPRKFG